MIDFFYLCKKLIIKIIFLDIDGVLRTHRSDVKWSEKLSCPVFTGTDRLFCEENVGYLNEIIFMTNAKIVVTSNWRLKLTVEALNKKFKERGVIGEVIDKTSPDFIRKNIPLVLGNRGLEIRQWLNDNYCKEYVVIDDQTTDILEYIPKLKVLKVNPMIGISTETVDHAVNILL